jgi:hypothetical protein
MPASRKGRLPNRSSEARENSFVPAAEAGAARTAGRSRTARSKPTAPGLILSLVLATGGISSLHGAGPVNDRFSNCIILAGTNLVVAGSNVDASEESGEPDHAGDPGGRSVWWAWTAPGDGDVQITTDGSSFDTLLGIYTGPRVSALTGVASNDDHGLLDTSRVRFQASGGTQYQIAVDGYHDGLTAASGTITLTLSFLSGPLLRPANDAFTNRTWLRGLQVVTSGSNVQATREPGELMHAQKLGDTSIWYAWTAPTSGVVRFSTAGSAFNTLLAVYSGSSLTSLTEVAANDDVDPDAGSLTSAVTFEAQAGQSFVVAVDGFDGAAGPVALTIETVSIVVSAPLRLTDGRFQFTVTGVSNRTYAVEASGDLTLWTGIGSVFNTNGTCLFTDPVARNLKRRYYRALLW